MHERTNKRTKEGRKEEIKIERKKEVWRTVLTQGSQWLLLVPLNQVTKQKIQSANQRDNLQSISTLEHSDIASGTFDKFLIPFFITLKNIKLLYSCH